MDKNSDGHHSALEGISPVADFLKSKYPDNVLIPLQPGTKVPAMAHKGGGFTHSCMKNAGVTAP